jgi:hypothetical protein
VKKVELDKIDIHAIKRLIVEIGSPIIPLTLIFEGLGFQGVTGIEWGILAGAVSALATELGYRVQKMGRSIILIKHTLDSAPKKDTPGNLDEERIAHGNPDSQGAL